MNRKKPRPVLTMKPLPKSVLQDLKREHARSWQAVVMPIKEAVRRSEQVTDKDRAIRINARS
jgi:hypothetical protein